VSEKILITEDDEDLAFVIREALVRLGYEAEVAPTAGALLDRLKASQYESHLCWTSGFPTWTVSMPFRASVISPRRRRIIVMTAHRHAADRINAITRGAYDFFTKPLKMAEFQVVVARAL